MANRFVGHIDSVEPVLAGWLVDRQHPNEPVRFTLAIDRTLRPRVIADRPRPDVAAAGFGGPDCGFAITLPAPLLDGGIHDIEFFAEDGQRLILAGLQSPLVLGPLSARLVPITGDDLTPVSELLRQTHIESGVAPDAITERYAANWIANFVGGAGGLLIGARTANHLAGYAALERARGADPVIGAVALSVLSQYRRKGLGEKLMRALMAGVRHGRQIDEVWLSVAPENLPALRLYEKLGFIYRTEAPSSLFVPATYLTMVWQPDRPAG
jgi:ribosomal protein S18 acetylase RimI-like enzyme